MRSGVLVATDLDRTLIYSHDAIAASGSGLPALVCVEHRDEHEASFMTERAAALYADLSLPLRRRLHERVAVVAVERGYSAAFVSAHYDHAMLSAPAYQYARVAASEASAVSAHREALQLYRRALRNRPRDIGASCARPSVNKVVCVVGESFSP